jgi:hypothetical protein
MIDDFVRDLRLLQKADSLIGKIWLNVIARRFGLFLFAGLIAVFGLGMTNVAGFHALAPLGPVWAAAIVAMADFVLAAIVMLVGRNAKPGPEIELAFDVRKMAIESIAADASALKVTMDAFGQELRETRDTIAAFVHNPLDAAAQKLLVPAVTSIIRGFRPSKKQA